MQDTGASTLIGAILAALGLVLVAGIVAVNVLSESPDDPTHVTVEPEQDGDALRLHHKGGDALAVDDTTLRLNIDGSYANHDLSTFASLQLGLQDGWWDPGDAICLSGTSSECPSTFAGQTIVEILVIHRDTVEMGWDGKIVGLEPLPDLSASYLRSNPSPPQQGTPTTFSVTVHNAGGADVAPAASVAVRFTMDGVFLSQTTVSGADLPSGGSTVATSGPYLPTLGLHTLEVAVDTTDVVREGDESDNTMTYSFAVGLFDPGFAYNDVDCNNAWDPAIDEQVSIAVHDGFYETPNCLVIPVSEGTIHLTSANSDAHYKAERIYLGADAHISGTNGDVELITTNGDFTTGPNVDIFASGSNGDVHIITTGNVILGTDNHIKTAGGDGADTIQAQGSIFMGAGTLVETTGSGGDLGFTSNGDVSIEDVEFQAPGGTNGISFDLTFPLYTVYLDGAVFKDVDDSARISPSGTSVDGTPASGGWGY